MLALSILINFLFILLRETLCSMKTPYPLILDLPNQSERPYPAYVHFEDKHLILTQGGTYELVENNGVYSLKKEEDKFKDFTITEKYNNCTIYRTGAKSVYVFSNVHDQVVIKVVDDGKESETSITLEEAMNGYRVDDYIIYNNNTITISFLNKDGYGLYYRIDPNSQKILQSSKTKTIVSQESRFSCKSFSKTNYHYCFYGTGGRQVFYVENNGGEIDGGINFFTMNGKTTDAKVVTLGNNRGVGLGYNNDYVNIFSIGFNPEVKVKKVEISDIKPIDRYSLDIMLFTSYFAMIVIGDGTTTYCRFYETTSADSITYIGSPPYEVCGYTDFRASVSDLGKYLNLLYTMNNDHSKIYYIKHQMINCQNMRYTSSTTETLDFFVTDLIVDSLDYEIEEDTGIFYNPADKATSLGYFSEIDIDANEIQNATSGNDSKFYHRLRYHPQKSGTEVYKYQIFSKVTKDFFVPTLSCTLTFDNICYEKCSTCTDMGNSDEHNCDTCIADYYFLEDTKNCLNVAPPGYYLADADQIYHRCPFHDCKVCTTDGLTCTECFPSFFPAEESNDCYAEDASPAGYYFNSGEQMHKKCAENCTQCELNSSGSGTTCINCIAGAYFKESTDECYIAPPDEYYFDSVTEEFKKCASNCLHCESDGTTCTACVSGAFLKDDTKECLTSKPPGYYQDANDENKYKKCGDNCENCDPDNSTCSLCFTGAYMKEDVSECYTSTPDEYYFNSNENQYCRCPSNCLHCDSTGAKCSECLTGAFLTEDTELCYTSIPDEYYFDSNDNMCKRCAQNCLHCDPDGSLCSECIVDAYFKGDTDECYTSAPDEYFYDADTGRYQKCGQNCLHCIDANTCSDCVVGSYKKENEDVCYSSCPPSHFFDSDLYKPCEANCFECSSEVACTDCKDDAYFKEGEENTICYKETPNDYFFDETSSKFKKCPSTCLNCAEICRNCPEGTYIVEDLLTCSLDSPDEYYFDQDTLMHMKCPDNCLHCNKENGIVLCSECVVNSYFIEGTKNCYSSTPEGYYLDGDLYKKCDGDNCATCTDSGTKCVACKANMFMVENTNNCYETAPPGHFLDNDNIFKTCSDNCMTCDNKQICTECYSNAYFAEGLTQCFTSPPDEYYFDSSALKFKKCSSNCKKCTNAITCNECVIDAFFAEGTSTCYTDSPDGFYFDAATSTFKHCMSHCKACSDSSSCSECFTGFVFKSTYSSIASDIDCVEQCDGTNDKFYFDTANNFVCLKDTSKCPYQYPCLNELTRECYQCGDVIPSDLPIKEMFDYLNEDIIAHYEDNFLLNNDEYTAIVYDTETNVSNASGNGNLTEIDLGDCARKLNIDLTKDPLIILQIEKKESSSLYDKITFAFYTKSGERIDLDKCSDTTMMLTTPIPNSLDVSNSVALYRKLSDRGINIFNYSSPFFSDKCSRFKSPSNGNDVLLKDRIATYLPNITFCGEGCTALGFNDASTYVTCECDVIKKQSYPLIQFNVDDNKYKYQHIKIFTCVDELFDSSLSKNVGSYIMLVLFVLQLINFVLYLLFSPKLFRERNFIDDNKKEGDNGMTRRPSHQLQNSESSIKSISDANDEENKVVIETRKNDHSNSGQMMIPKRNELVILNQSKESTKKKNSLSNKEVQKTDNNMDLTSKPVITEDKAKSTEEAQELPSSHINVDILDYNESLDKINENSFCKIFSRRLKQFNPIYVIFIEKDPLKIVYLYSACFVLIIQMEIFFNVMLYFDSYISNTFYEGYKFYPQLGSDVLAALLSMLVVFAAKLLIVNFPNDKEILQNVNGSENYREKRSKKMKILNYVFFGIVIGMSVFMWYYVSVFTAVFENSQMYLIYAAVMSIAVYFIFVCIAGAVTSAIRVLALKYKCETIFNVNRIFEKF